jgi:hypothetical protein
MSREETLTKLKQVTNELAALSRSSCSQSNPQRIQDLRALRRMKDRLETTLLSLPLSSEAKPEE